MQQDQDGRNGWEGDDVSTGSRGTTDSQTELDKAKLHIYEHINPHMCTSCAGNKI